MTFKHVEHTADLMFHCWDRRLAHVLEDCISAMNTVLRGLENETGEVSPNTPPQSREKARALVKRRILATGRDGTHMLYDLLDQYLGLFTLDHYISQRTEVYRVEGLSEHGRQAPPAHPITLENNEGRGEVPDVLARSVKCWVRLWGEVYDPVVHGMGCEIKAVTMHNLSLWNRGATESSEEETEDGVRRRSMSKEEDHDPQHNPFLWNATFVLDV